MDKLEILKQQIVELQKLGKIKNKSKIQDLIAQIYNEFKKINKRAPTLTEWKSATGVDVFSLDLVRDKGGYPLGSDPEMELERRRKITKFRRDLRVGTTGTIFEGGRETGSVSGVRFANAAEKTKVKNILTKYLSVPTSQRDITDVHKQLRSIKDLKPLSRQALSTFLYAARKQLNIPSTVQTEAARLHRPANVQEAILRSLTEHIRQGGTDFKYAPGGKATVFRGLKIIDIKNPKTILTRDSVKEAIKNNDPRFREYVTKWNEMEKLKKTPFTHPITGVKMTLLEALKEGSNRQKPLQLDHIRGVKTSPLNDLAIVTWKGNIAKKMKLTTKEAKLFGVKTVVPGGTSIVGPDISFAKRESDLIKFATDLFKKGGTREILKPRAHLDQFLAIFNSEKYTIQRKVANALNCGDAEGGRIGYALGTATIKCVNQKLTNEPVQSSMRLRATEGIGKIRGAATNFLKLLGRGGVKALPFAGLAAAGAAAEPLVKQFRSDDYSTYLSDPEQQKGMLLSMLEAETPKVDQEILKWKYPGEVAAIGAGAVPGAGELYKQRRAIRPQKLPGQPAFIGPMPKGVGKARAALGISGVLGKALGATFSPLAVAATLPFNVAAQRSAGTDYSDIAADPMTWMGPAFASTGAEMATRGIKNPLLLRALRLGMSPGALRMGSRFLGLPGLALTGGMWAYDKWKDRGKDKDDEFKVRKYTDDDE